MATKLPVINGGDEFDPLAQRLLTDAADYIGRLLDPKYSGMSLGRRLRQKQAILPSAEESRFK